MKTRLGDVASYINGYAFKPSDWTDDGVPIIRIQDLTGNSYKMNRFNGTIDSKYDVVDGDILISWSASLGVYVWKGEKSILNQHIFKVILDEQRVLKPFYIHQAEYILEKAGTQAHGATMKHLTRPIFNALPFYLPNLEEQQKVAAVLECVDGLINKYKQHVHALDELVKSRFMELFGDLKSNSKGWPIVAFTECAEIDTNMIHDFDGYENYPHIGIDSIEKETGRLSGYRTVAEDGVISGKYLFTEKHIIYSKIRPNLNKVAMPDFVGVCSADAYPILAKDGVCEKVYLAYTMRSKYFLDYILALSSRTNLPKVNKKQVEGFALPLPAIGLQQQFAAFAAQVDKSKLAAQKGLQELEILKKSLMQQYFG